MVELTSGSALPGDSLRQRSAVLTAKVTNTNVGQRTITARWVKNGVPDDPFDVTEEGQMFTRDATAPPTGEDRYRFEVLLSDNKPHLITNHIFLTLDPNGPDPAAQGSSGGGCATTSDAPGTTPWLIFLAAMAAGGILSRRRRA
jgi:MYXO-CTERM domain-containing protein